MMNLALPTGLIALVPLLPLLSALAIALLHPAGPARGESGERLSARLSLEGGPRISAWVASILCLFLGTALLLYVQGGGKEASVDPAAALTSGHWETRVAALKLIEQKKLDVGDFEAYPRLMKSRHVAERYCLVRTLGSSRRTSTYRDLLGFLDDPNPGVVSMAFYALGQRKDSRAVPEILKRIETSGDWYNQWYAYRALRNLGWKQSKSR